MIPYITLPKTTSVEDHFEDILLSDAFVPKPFWVWVSLVSIYYPLHYFCPSNIPDNTFMI